MSQFINGSFGLPVTIHAPSEIRHCDQQYFGPRTRALSPSPYTNERRRRADNAHPLYIYANRWWPKDTAIIGGWSGSGDDVFQNYPAAWIDPRTNRGASSRLGFVGVTRDAYGNPLSGCTVRLYRTSTEELVQKVTSDAGGMYYATTPYNDGHFIVIHSPDGLQAGATKNNLIPA